jgi:hypothetical protein
MPAHGQPPEPTELVFLPRPSWLPMLVALGFALIVVGLFAWWPYSVGGALIFLPAVYVWIRGARHEVGRMPREQQPSAAVLPAVQLRRPPTEAG